MGVQNLSLSTDTIELKDDLYARRESLAEHELHLIWDLPVPYSQYNPVTLEVAPEIAEREMASNGPGQAWLYVEPDGDVLPGQGFYDEVLGNFVTDPWERIWQNASQLAQISGKQPQAG
jgi:MoaA/NifB/PqqE/SkfB family radical SAM enzyme